MTRKPRTILLGSGHVSSKGRLYLALHTPAMPKPGYTFRLIAEIHPWRARRRK